MRRKYAYIGYRKKLEGDEKFDEELIKENLCPELKDFLTACMERAGMSYPNRLAAGTVSRGFSAYAEYCRKVFAVCKKYV